MRTFSKHLLVTLVAVSLTACGGGESSPSAATLPTKDAATTSAPTIAVTTSTSAPSTSAAPTTEIATTTTEDRTGSFSECPPDKVLNDHDGDGWGACTTPTTTTIDPTIGEGVWIVGSEIAPGLYRVAGYWARLDASMEIIDNDGVYDNGVGLLNVRETDVYVEISGAALPLGETRTLDPVIEGFSEGTYLVNWDIQPGRYRITPANGRSAYFSRLDAEGDIIDNNLADGQLIVIVEPTDWALQISGTIEVLP